MIGSVEPSPSMQAVDLVGQREAAVQHDAGERREGAGRVGEQRRQQHLGAVGRDHHDRALGEPRQHVHHRHPGDDDAEHLAGQQLGVALDAARPSTERMTPRTDGATRKRSSGSAQTGTDRSAPAESGDAAIDSRRSDATISASCSGSARLATTANSSARPWASSASASDGDLPHLGGRARDRRAELLGLPLRPPGRRARAARARRGWRRCGRCRRARPGCRRRCSRCRRSPPRRTAPRRPCTARRSSRARHPDRRARRRR